MWLLAGGSAVAGQPEGLKYRESAATYSSIGGPYEQCQSPTTTAPQAVELPKFNGDRPLFVRWETPRSADGYVRFALDRSGESGAYDLLYVDSDLDGLLADEQPVKARTARSRTGSDYSRSEFKLVKLLLPGRDGPAAYHLNVVYRRDGGKELVRFEPACWYEGPVTIGGRAFRCTLIDGNGNGRFGEGATNGSQADLIRLAPTADTPSRNHARNSTTHFAGRYVQVDGKLYAMEIDPAGAYANFSPADKGVIGTIQVGKPVSAFSVFGQEGQFSCEPKDGAADVPAGKYVLETYEVNRTDDHGAGWQLKPTGAGAKETFTVEAGKVTALAAAGPFVCRLGVSKREDTYIISRSLKTETGDDLALACNGSRCPAPKIRITSADGSYNREFRMEYGCCGGCSLSWREPDDAKGPFTVRVQVPGPFEFKSEPVVIRTGNGG